jgi:hypothetical protein
MTKTGRINRKPFKIKRAAFILADDYHNLTIANVMMKVQLAATGVERNIWKGEIAEAWKTLPDNLKKLQVVGVLHADRTKMYEGRIEWLEEGGVVTHAQDVDSLQADFALKAMAVKS